MSKRCELQKEYYQTKGNYKGIGKYSNDYVIWLEDKVMTCQHPYSAIIGEEHGNPECLKCGEKL